MLICKPLDPRCAANLSNRISRFEQLHIYLANHFFPHLDPARGCTDRIKARPLKVNQSIGRQAIVFAQRFQRRFCQAGIKWRVYKNDVQVVSCSIICPPTRRVPQRPRHLCLQRCRIGRHLLLAVRWYRSIPDQPSWSVRGRVTAPTSSSCKLSANRPSLVVAPNRAPRTAYGAGTRGRGMLHEADQKIYNPGSIRTSSHSGRY